jgi:hypothetical protein
MNGGENISGVIVAFRLGSFTAHYIFKRHTRRALLSIWVVPEPRPTKEMALPTLLLLQHLPQERRGPANLALRYFFR